MKKHLLATLIAVMTCCLAVLSGCAVSVFEKNVNVVFENNGKYVDGVTVNSFNNAIAPVFDEEAEGAVPEGYKFMGWSVKSDWKYGDNRDLLISSGGIVRYDFVKDYANEGGTAVARPIIIAKDTIPKADLVIAWYGKTSTSGISQDNMNAFETALRAYLAAEGMDVSGMEIIIRSYEGNVGPSCENIRKDDDVDIMIGWSNTDNLIGTGGMVAGKNVLENVGGITIGSKERYAARLTDRELGVKVYAWIQQTYGNGSAPEILTPEEKPEPKPEPPVPSEKKELRDTVLNVSVWNNRAKEWIDVSKLADLERDFKAYLTERYTNADNVTVNWTDEVAVYLSTETEVNDKQPNVAALVKAVNEAGNIDFVLACGNNVNSAGNLDNLVKKGILSEKSTAYGIKSDRLAAILHKDAPNELASQLYEFLTGESYKPELSVTQLNVSVWNNRAKEWIDVAKLPDLEKDFKAYLAETYSNADSVTISWTDEVAVYLSTETEVNDKQPNVAALVKAVNDAGNIDFVLACGNNVNSAGNLDNLVKNKLTAESISAYGIKSDRQVAVLHQDTPNQLAVMLYEFMTGVKFTNAAA